MRTLILPTRPTLLANLLSHRWLFVALFLALTLVASSGNASASFDPNIEYDLTAGIMMTVPTLAVNGDTMQTGLFTGANIILVALGGIVFLLIGFSFGGKILRAISDFIQRFSF